MKKEGSHSGLVQRLGKPRPVRGSWVRIPPLPQKQQPPKGGCCFSGGASKLLCLRWDEKAGAMREFPPKAEGERREARPGGNFRQEIYRRGIPPLPPRQKINLEHKVIFCLGNPTVSVKKSINFRILNNKDHGSVQLLNHTRRYNLYPSYNLSLSFFSDLSPFDLFVVYKLLSFFHQAAKLSYSAPASGREPLVVVLQKRQSRG